MILTNQERETIITFNEADKTASVYTHNKALRRTLDKLTHERPNECYPTSTNHDGQAADYILPKSWVKIRPSRIMSDAQRKALEKARLTQKTPVPAGFQDHITTTEGNYTP